MDLHTNLFRWPAHFTLGERVVMAARSDHAVSFVSRMPTQSTTRAPLFMWQGSFNHLPSFIHSFNHSYIFNLKDLALYCRNIMCTVPPHVANLLKKTIRFLVVTPSMCMWHGTCVLASSRQSGILLLPRQTCIAACSTRVDT